MTAPISVGGAAPDDATPDVPSDKAGSSTRVSSVSAGAAVVATGPADAEAPINADVPAADASTTDASGRASEGEPGRRPLTERTGERLMALIAVLITAAAAFATVPTLHIAFGVLTFVAATLAVIYVIRERA